MSCTAGRGNHVRLYDAYSSGDLIQTYFILDQYQEPLPCNSVCFSSDGTKIYAGRNNAIHGFQINEPDFDKSFVFGTREPHIAKKSYSADVKDQKLLSGIQSSLAEYLLESQTIIKVI